VFLIEKFHEFYRELVATHAQLHSGEIRPEVAHERLVSLLNRQESEAQRESGYYGTETFRRAKYAMAALGDELMLRRDDGHGETWMGHLLETALFRSQRAGEKLFDDIDEMQNLGSSAAELAMVYLAVLGLDFQGCFRGLADPKKEIDVYRRKLYRLSYGREPVVVTGEQPIAAAAYASTLTDGEGGQLPHIRPWIYALLLIVVLYIVAGEEIWRYATNDLEGPLQTINTSVTRAPGGKP
jgi:type VI secretion system protein ImpK